MKSIKPSLFLTIGSWACLLVLIWMILIGSIKSNFIAWFFFAFFLLVALISSAVFADNKEKKKRGIVEVNHQGELYSESDGRVQVVENSGHLFVFIRETVPVDGKSELSYEEGNPSVTITPVIVGEKPHVPTRPEPAPPEDPFQHSIKIGGKKRT